MYPQFHNKMPPGVARHRAGLLRLPTLLLSPINRACNRKARPKDLQSRRFNVLSERDALLREFKKMPAASCAETSPGSGPLQLRTAALISGLLSSPTSRHPVALWSPEEKPSAMKDRESVRGV
jgi:hypothetical protein